MMNKKRVRVFRKLIYAFIIIVLFLPLILMSFLTLRMLSVSQAMQNQLQTLTSAVSQPAPQSSSQGGYVIEPEVQSTNGESLKPQTIDGKDAETNADDRSPDASGVQPEADGIPSAQLTSDTGGATINGIGNNTLNELTGGNTSNSGTSDTGGNPDTGIRSAEDVSPPNYNGNPGMGC